MAAERMHTFLMLKRGGKPERVLVWDTVDISVGRAPDNDLVLDEPEMSRNHARFCKSDAGYTIQNLSMSNPTTVNGASVGSQPLKNKDVIGIADIEFVFCQVPQNPATLKLPLEYASQLKNFGPKIASGDGEATILGLMDEVGGPSDEEFVVRPASDFEHDLHGIPQPPLAKPRTRNLDLELADDGLGDLDLPPAKAAPKAAPARPAAQKAPSPGVEVWARSDEATGAVSLQLEIQGLSGAQRASVLGLIGKVIELPRLRIRIKGEDLG
jgi:predicted component of type VI protein secretion system